MNMLLMIYCESYMDLLLGLRGKISRAIDVRGPGAYLG
jgi:hypothetical protein